METEPARIYRREWKVNKPYLPKSTSLPLLRLNHEDRAIFVCKRCGFSNFLVPMCLWCCWSSAEARRDFEVRAAKTLRRAARSAPRLFNRPALSVGPYKRRDTSTGKHGRSGCRRLNTATTPRSSTTVTSTCTMISPASRVLKHVPWALNYDRRNRGKEVISGKRRSSNQQSQGPYTDCGSDDCGTGSAENNGPTRIQHSSLRPDFLLPNHQRAGYHHKAKDATVGSSHSPSLGCEHCPQVALSLERPQNLVFGRLPLYPHYFSAHEKFASTTPIIRGRDQSSIRTMLEDAPTTDTRCDTPNVPCHEWSPSITTTHQRSLACHGDPTTQLHCRNHRPQEIAATDVGVSTVIQRDQMNQGEDTTTSTVQPIGLGIKMTTDSTTMKISKNRAPIPSIFLYQDKNHTDVPTAPEQRVSIVPVINETTKKDPPPSPARTLKRKKRLSLIGFSSTNSSGLTLPERSPPLSPPPFEDLYSHPPSSPVRPPTATPPGSTNNAYLAPEKFSPSIVISTPTSITPIMIEPSRPIPPLARTPPETLPRIGTPKRPYYSTVRANINKTNSSFSYLSTSPASPSSPTFSSAAGEGSPSPVLGEAPEKSDQSSHLDAEVSMRAGSEDASGAGKTYQPVSPISAVPPLSSVMTTSPTATPIPVQMHLQPSSPARSILSVLDPAYDDEEDEEGEEVGCHQFGLNSARFDEVLQKRRNSSLKGKDKARGDGGSYHFPFSLSLSLKRKPKQTLETTGSKSDREDSSAPIMPTLFPSRSYNGLGGLGTMMGSGCSVSGQMEMRMALAERSLNTTDGSGNRLEPAFKFRQSPRPSYDGEHLVRRKSSGNRIMRIRSSIGLSSTPLTASPPPSPSKPNIRLKLKEMSASFLGKFSGGDANRS